MGLDNYVFEEDRLKPWEKTLPVFDSENDIKKSNDVQESSLDHNGICFEINPHGENPYSVLPENSKNYNERASNQCAIKSKFQNDSRALSCKKTNSIYETTELEPKTKYRTKQVKGYFSGIEDNFKCTFLVFSFLVAIIAITSTVMVFMIVFGVISVQKCKECKLFDPKSEMQTQINTEDNVKSKLEKISENFNATNLKTDELYAKIVKDEIQIKNLTRQLNEQNKLLQLLLKKNDEIVNLTQKLEINVKTVFESQINFTDARLNKISSHISFIKDDVYRLKTQLDQANRSISNLTLREGPRGLNGSEGSEGKSADFKNCNSSTKVSIGNGTSVDAIIFKSEVIGKVVIAAFCTSSSTSLIEFKIEKESFTCKCIFPISGNDYKCYIHYWHC